MYKVKTTFSKKALSISQQIEFLRSRSLKISNPTKAANFLKFIGLYRFNGYARFFGSRNFNGNHEFPPSLEFERIVELYNFDRKLRLLVLDGIEKIEVAIRATISNTLSEKYGPHWYLDCNKFNANFNFIKFINEIKGSTYFSRKDKQKPNFKHYYHKYQEPPYPPSWMVAESLSLGTWSIIFKELAERKIRNTIASTFHLHQNALQSWLRSITWVRNLCAHHERLWNAHFVITPCIPGTLPKEIQKHFIPNNLFSRQAACIHYLLFVIDASNLWSRELALLMLQHSWISVQAMGYEEDWYNDSFWLGKNLIR